MSHDMPWNIQFVSVSHFSWRAAVSPRPTRDLSPRACRSMEGETRLFEKLVMRAKVKQHFMLARWSRASFQLAPLLLTSTNKLKSLCAEKSLPTIIWAHNMIIIKALALFWVRGGCIVSATSLLASSSIARRIKEVSKHMQRIILFKESPRLGFFFCCY